MKKIFLWNKRKMSIVLIVVMLLGVMLGNVIYTTWASEEEMTYEQYKADYYINYSPYQYYMSEDFSLPYRTQVEKNRGDAVYNALLIAWQAATFEISDVTEYSTRKVAYYESFLYDILYTGYNATNVSKTLSNSVKSMQASTLKKMSKLGGEEVKAYAEKNLKEFTDADWEAFHDVFSACNEFENAFEAVGNITNFLDYASTVEELVYKLAKIEVISRLSIENAEVLERIAANTNDLAMQTACYELADICRGALTIEQMAVLLTSSETAKELADYALDTIWSEVTEKMSLYGLAVSVGQSAGKWVGGWFISGDKEVETFYEMCALYDFENELRKVVRSYETAYTSNKTERNAKLYNTSFEMLLQTMELACDISVEYSSITYDDDGAPIGLFISYVTGNHDKFEQFKKSLTNIKNQLSWLYDYANTDMYQLYCDEYCSDVMDVIEMQPEPNEYTSEEMQTTLTELRQNVFASTDIYITDDYILTEDTETFCNLYIQGGNVDLNGHKLTAQGDLLQSGGTLYVNGGKLDVTGDYYIAGSRSIGEDGKEKTSYCNAVLKMMKDADVVRVDGDFLTYSNQEHGNYLTAGLMSVGGNFTQKIGSSLDRETFDATGNHKVVFNGTGTQKIMFADTTSGFANVEFQNKDIEFASNIRGFELGEDINLTISTESFGVDGTWKLNGHSLGEDGINGTEQFKFTGGTIDLGGSTVKINGDLLQSGGTLYVNGGELDVTGDYYIAGSRGVGEDGKETITSCSAMLKMMKDADAVRVDGNFLTASSQNHGNYLIAGTMYLGGNFTQKSSSSYNFAASGTHTTILDSETKQNITFESTSSHFNNLKLMKDKETGYAFSPDNCWNTLYMESNVNDVMITPNEVTVSQNDTQQFIAKVNGINKPDQSVKWEISGNTSEKTTISDKGMLSVPLDEEAESITVKATSVQDTSKSAEVTVTIAKAIPEVYWVKISPNNLGLSRGDKQTFKATVAGINNPSQEVVWSVEGNEKEQTVISQEGVLQIAADETANVLRVKAISKQDETKEAYVEVAVLDSEEVIYDSMVNRVLLDAQTVDLELGDSKTFTARVLGINSPSQIVEWTIEGNTSEDTWIDAEGTLSIGNDEEADQITVKATSVQNRDKYATATINVVKMRIVPTIDDVAIVLAPGESLQFKAKVMGTNEPSQEVEWILEGNESSQTTISADGFLSVAEDETATVVMLTARSLADNTKTATIAIGIEQPEDDDGKGNEEEDDTPVVPDDEEQDDGHTPVTPDDSGKPTVSPGESDDNKVVSPIEKPKGQTTGDRNVISTLPSVGTAITDSNTNASYVVTEPGKTVVYNKVLNKKIKKVIVPSAIYVNGVSYKVTSVAQNAFSGCKKLKSVTIGNGVTFIGNNAFKKCTSIKKIIIPEKVTSIGKNAFAGCKKLKSIIIKSKTLRKIGKNAFKGIHKNARIKVPKNKLKSYSKLLRKAKTGKNVKIIK